MYEHDYACQLRANGLGTSEHVVRSACPFHHRIRLPIQTGHVSTGPWRPSNVTSSQRRLRAYVFGH
jgi:hypothetical protein